MALKFLNDGYFAGKVGIGTASPSEKLEVGGNVKVTGAGGITIASFAPELNLTANNSGASTVNFGDTSSVNIARIYYNHSSNYMHFKINNAERMRIDSAGNVGIGTTSPTTKLNVSGDIAVSSGSYLSFIDSNINYNKIGRNTSVGGIQITTGASATMNLLDNGNVGIGTTNPDVGRASGRKGE